MTGILIDVAGHPLFQDCVVQTDLAYLINVVSISYIDDDSDLFNVGA